jgi:hypothetical protein
MDPEAKRAAAAERQRRKRERDRLGLPPDPVRVTARIGGKARHAHPAPAPAPEVPDATDDRSAVGFQSIEDYDRQVGVPADWGQAQQREKTRGELTLNDSRKVDLERARLSLEKERGKLVSLDDVEAREERADEIFQRHLASVLDLAASLVPPDQIAGAREKSAAWLAERQRLIASEMG